MATAKQITAKYIDFISRAVIDKFGGSYQTYQTLGNSWRTQLKYNPVIENYILMQTHVFIRMLDDCNLRDLNVMFIACDNMADYLSKYISRKSPDLTRKIAKKELMDNIFFKSSLLVEKYKKRYKKPVDIDNKVWAVTNPGVVAMHNALQNQY